MKILVTGSNGYVGKRVVKTLKTEGHAVHGFDVQAQGFEDDLLPQQWHDRYASEVQPNRYDTIVHTGAIAQAHYREPDLFFWNVETTKILLNQAIRDVSRFVFCSTGMAIDPHNFYGWSKRCAEHIGSRLEKALHCPFIQCVRWGFCYPVCYKHVAPLGLNEAMPLLLLSRTRYSILKILQSWRY